MSGARRSRSRWWQRLGWIALTILLVAALVLIGLEVTVRQTGVREAIKNRLEQEVAARTGLALQLGELKLSLLHPFVELSDVSVGLPGEAPILRIEQVEAQLRLSSIWNRPFTLKLLRIAGPEIDLEAPLPAKPSGSESATASFDLVVEQFRLVDGRVDGPVVPAKLESWIEEWWLQDLRLEGFYGPARLELALHSVAHWLRTDGAKVEVAIAGDLQGPQQGPWQLSKLTLTGDGMDATLSATLGTQDSQPLEGQIELEVEPHLLVPVPPAGAPIRADVQFDARRSSGSARVVATGLPMELASPWLAEDSLDPRLLADWRVDLTTDLALEGLEGAPTGVSSIRLTHDNSTWVTGGIELLPSETGALGARVEASLLPERRGRRSLRADIEAPGWDQLDQLVVAESEFEIVDTDLSTLRRDLATVWPEPLPESIDKALQGSLQATVEVQGPIADPEAQLAGSWRDGEANWVRLQGSGSVDGLLLDAFEGEIAGRSFRGSGSVALPAPIAQAELQLQIDHPLEGVEEASLLVRLESGTLKLQLEPRTANGATSRVVASVPLAEVARLPTLADSVANLPIVRASGPVRVEWQIPRAEWQDLVALAQPELPLSELSLGSTGSLTLDLRRPLATSGEVVVDGLSVGYEDALVTGDGPLTVRLAGGEVILEPTRLGTSGGVLELEIWADLDTHWRLGSPVAEALEQFRVEANGNAPVALLGAFVDDVATDGDLQVGVSLAGTAETLTGELRILGRDASLQIGGPDGLVLTDPVVELAFEEDVVRVREARIGVEAGEVRLSGEAPLATLRSLAESQGRDSGQALAPLRLRLEIPAADWAPTLSKVGVEEVPDALLLGATAEIEVDPSRPLEASGWLEIDPLVMTLGDHEVANQGPVRLDLAAGHLQVAQFELSADGQPFTLTGAAALAPSWNPEQSLASIVERFSFEGGGILAAALLNPWLAGGRADGLLQVDFEVAGSLADPTGRIRIAGPTASVVYLSPYVAKIEAPELDLELVDGRARIRDGRVRLNDGDVELEGSLGLDGIDVMAAFDGLRFRLDYGLFAKVDGELDLVLDSQGRGRLSGDIIVDQGSLTRPISIDRDFITNLLTPIDLTGSEASPLEQIALDLRLETRRGVRVRNNVADLAVGWNGVRVRGNLLEPVIDGRFTFEPGGRAFLFGQTLRIDSGVITFPGQPGAEAILDLETTSSLDDPTISRLAGEDDLSLGQLETERSLRTSAEGAAAAFVGEQLETRVNEFVPAARLTFRPILIFGEADPGARLTIGREFSRYVTLAASLDLRNAERQTYLMEAHSLPKLPGLLLQVFTNDLEQEGATLQHRLRFGAYRRKAPTGPTLRRLQVDAVPDVKARSLRRSVGLVKGDRASADDLFLVEVEVGEFLRSLGYPDAQVEVISRPVAENPQRVDLEVSIEPGPRARFRFEGEDLPRALQRSITSLYRTDFYEAQSIEEMRSQTVRALRSLGYLRPDVEIEVAQSQSVEGLEERLVTVHMQGGEQVDLEKLTVEGLPDLDAETVAAGFSTRVQLVELAVGEPAADNRLIAITRSLGYAAPEIASRNLSQDGRQLVVLVTPGEQRYLAAVSVEGVAPERAAELGIAAGVEAGEVARRDRIVEGALAIERSLRREGYAKARVQPRVEPDATDPQAPIELVYQVEPGIGYTVADAEFEGLRSTSRRWATNVAELESGAPLREDEVYAARSRLYDTGLFTMVNSETIEIDGGATGVVFNVEERPRFSVAYGFRWDSDEGTQGVFDAIDQNFLGRSVTLGFRGLYKQDDWSVRLAAGVPRLFGSRAVLELFGTYRDTFDETTDELFTSQFDEQTVEGSVQIAYPFGDKVSGRVYGRYRVADLLVTDIDQDPIFPLPPTELEFRFKTPLLGTLWIYDTRDRELVLTRGTFASLDLSGTGDFIDSDFEYVRLFSQFNVYRRVGRWRSRNLGWAQSVRLGLADSFEQELDRNDRFFAGGQYSIRGYPTDSLGPVEELGDQFFPLGGKSLLVINEEFRFDVWNPVAGLVFFDLGNVWEDTAEFDSSLFKSIGIGLRADTPIGLLRLDWAFPLDRREGDSSSKVYFGFGNTF